MSVDRLSPQLPSIPAVEPVNVVQASFPRVFVSGTPGDDALRASIPVFRLMPDAVVPPELAHVDAIFYLDAERRARR